MGDALMGIPSEEFKGMRLWLLYVIVLVIVLVIGIGIGVDYD
jgi:hypothetical protein